MIDRLELIIPEIDALTNECKELRREVCAKAVLDQRSGRLVLKNERLNVQVFEFRKHPNVRDFGAVRLNAVSRMSSSQIRVQVATVFREPQTVRIRRIDFAVDVLDLPVRWFFCNMFVAGVRSSRSWWNCAEEYSVAPNHESARFRSPIHRALTSFRLGSHRGTSYFFAYDKLAERRAKNQSVADWEGASTVTRIEHHVSGKSIPREMTNVEGLIRSVPDADPFPSDKVLLRRGIVLRPYNLKFADVRDMKFLETMMAEHSGIHAAMRQIAKDGGNTAHFKKLLPLLAPEYESCSVDLTGLFRTSVAAQLSGKPITTHQARIFIRQMPAPETQANEGLREIVDFALREFTVKDLRPETRRTSKYRKSNEVSEDVLP